LSNILIERLRLINR